MSRRWAALVVALAACDEAAPAGSDAVAEGAVAEDAGAQDWRAPVSVEEAYASELISFEAGEGAGFGQTKMPGVVLGPPQGGGASAQSLDVLSLGAGGTLVMGFGDRVIADGPGPDLIVFENAFYAGGNPDFPFFELAEVSVSMDGESWTPFPCDPAPVTPPAWPGCAGWRPVDIYDPAERLPPDPAVVGGDPFDLADIGVTEARFVRIRDLTTIKAPPSAGFDLDAIAVLHLR